MKIEDVLKGAGIELTDEQAQAVKDAMPKAFIPLEDFNKRIAKASSAKDEAEKLKEDALAQVAELQKAAEAIKADAGSEKSAELEKTLSDMQKLQDQYADLEGKFTAAQDAIKQRDAREQLTKALTAAGANPSAVALLVGAASSSIEFDDEGKPSNIETVAEQVKTDNAGLFGEPVDTSIPAAKADEKNAETSDFLKGFNGQE